MNLSRCSSVLLLTTLICAALIGGSATSIAAAAQPTVRQPTGFTPAPRPRSAHMQAAPGARLAPHVARAASNANCTRAARQNPTCPSRARRSRTIEVAQAPPREGSTHRTRGTLVEHDARTDRGGVLAAVVRRTDRGDDRRRARDALPEHRTDARSGQHRARPRRRPVPDQPRARRKRREPADDEPRARTRPPKTTARN